MDPEQGPTSAGGDGAELPSPPAWLRQLCTAADALRDLAQAQWRLAGAEWRLARSAAMIALVAASLVAVFAIALGLVLLAVAALLLMEWLHSWLLALLVLAVIVALCLAASGVLFRRCLHWMSLPETRAQWRVLAKDLSRSTVASNRSDAKGTQGNETASSTD